MQAYTKVGLDALLTPDNCVVVMIDHQPFQLANVNGAIAALRRLRLEEGHLQRASFAAFCW